MKASELPFDKLSPAARQTLRRFTRQSGPQGFTVATVQRHALAVAALLCDGRGLTPSEARKVLRKALELI